MKCIYCTLLLWRNIVDLIICTNLPHQPTCGKNPWKIPDYLRNAESR